MLLALTAWAQPNGTGNYYQDANGKKGKSLKTALFGIIKNPDVVSYDGLWSAYLKTDLRSDGKIWDMYSDITNFDPVKGHAANYKKKAIRSTENTRFLRAGLTMLSLCIQILYMWFLRMAM